MSFNFIEKLPIPMVTKERYPMEPDLVQIKEEKDAEIRKIFTGESDKFLLVIGPCSADNEEAVLDYCSRLAKVQEKVADRIVIVPRVYTSKPRTTGLGYKGILHQPDPEKKPALYNGVLAVRQLHMDVIKQTGFTTPDEILYPENYRYMQDILSYNFIWMEPTEEALESSLSHFDGEVEEYGEDETMGYSFRRDGKVCLILISVAVCAAA